MRLHGDERGILIGWMVKLTLFLAVVGVVIFDAGSIAVNLFTLDTAADDTAIALSIAIDPSTFQATDQYVFEQARLIVSSDDTLAGDARVVQNGTRLDENGVIHVKLRRTADTLVVDQFTALRKWGRATAEGSASTK